MQTFEDFFFEKQVIPPCINITINGIGNFTAKADTGNDGYNVLHATDIVPSADSVRFVCSGKQLNMPTAETLTVNKGPEQKENRPVIKLTVAVNGKVYKDQPFTISDRTGMDQPVLLSREFITQMNSVVDPSIR